MTASAPSSPSASDPLAALAAAPARSYAPVAAVPGVVAWSLALAVLRIGSSWSWLSGALLGADAKLRGDFLSGHGLSERILAPATGFAHTAVSPAISQLLTTVVVPHAALFAWLIALGEAAIGASMLTGTLARLGGVLAILRAIVNVAVGGWNPDVVGHNWMLALAGLVVLISAAGRSYGVDELLLRRFPHSRFLRLVA